MVAQELSIRDLGFIATFSVTPFMIKKSYLVITDAAPVEASRQAEWRGEFIAHNAKNHSVTC